MSASSKNGVTPTGKCSRGVTYWCYYLHIFDERNIERLVKTNDITFPEKYDIKEKDVIFIYRRGKNSGFMGYVRSKDVIHRSITDDDDIFDDKSFNKFMVNLSYIKILMEPMKKGVVIKADKQLANELELGIKGGKFMRELTNELGRTIKSEMKTQDTQIPEMEVATETTETTEEQSETSDDTESETEIDSEGSSEYESDDGRTMLMKINEMVEKRGCHLSRHLIPILIIPCNKLQTEMRDKKITDAQYIIEHASECRYCDVTNNNDRIPLNMVQQQHYAPAYLLDDMESIESILDDYYNMNYYSVKQTKVYKINNTESDYDGCYIVVGKMDKRL